jgi:ketosteroid isomerase-like protein
MPFVVILAFSFFSASCASSPPQPGNIVRQYYEAIENGDVDAAAALFTQDASITTPGGNIVSGEEIKSQFISFDIESMEKVEYQTVFSERGDSLTWTQKYTNVFGSTFFSNCQILLEDGKIAMWTFK